MTSPDRRAHKAVSMGPNWIRCACRETIWLAREERELSQRLKNDRLLDLYNTHAVAQRGKP